MSKKKDASADGDSDATIVVARVPGPIAAWRLTLAVAVTALTTGMPLVAATETGQHLDQALGRTFGVAFVVWFAAGRINRVFVDVEHKRLAAPTKAVEAVASSAAEDARA